jgi:hypothetical protein
MRENCCQIFLFLGWGKGRGLFYVKKRAKAFYPNIL